MNTRGSKKKPSKQNQMFYVEYLQRDFAVSSRNHRNFELTQTFNIVSRSKIISSGF